MPDEDLIRSRTQQTPTARELAMVLFRRRRVFVCVSGLVLGLALLYALVGTSYEAKMQILVRRGRADAPVSAQQDAPIDMTRMAATEEDLNSEVELLKDDEVLRQVVEKAGSSGRDWFAFLHRGETPAERVERLARRLGKNLQVEPTKKTNLIAVHYQSSDPQRAEKVLRAVGNAYLEKHTLVHRPSGEFRFFDQQKEESRLQLEQAKGRLLEFSTRHGVVLAAQQRDLALAKLSEVGANHRQTLIDLAETRRRIAELEAQLAKTKFEPTHRLVQEVDKQIEQNESAIAAENLLPLRDETTDKNSRYEWAKAELQSTQVLLRALEAREAATGVQEAAYHTMARQLGEDAITQRMNWRAQKRQRRTTICSM